MAVIDKELNEPLRCLTISKSEEMSEFCEDLTSKP